MAGAPWSVVSSLCCGRPPESIAVSLVSLSVEGFVPLWLSKVHGWDTRCLQDARLPGLAVGPTHPSPSYLYQLSLSGVSGKCFRYPWGWPCTSCKTGPMRGRTSDDCFSGNWAVTPWSCIVLSCTRSAACVLPCQAVLARHVARPLYTKVQIKVSPSLILPCPSCFMSALSCA